MDIWQVWLILALIFFVIELFTTGIAVICFSFGAILSALVAGLGGNFTWQVIFFAVVSILSFILIRPLLLKAFTKNGKDSVKTNAEAIIGRQGVVSERIDRSQNTGRVALDGDDWKAVSENGEIIEKGERVEIVKLESIIVTVKRV